jgi:L-arabinonolactonase
MKISRVDSAPTAIGESPVWDVAEQCLYYVDVVGKEVRRYAMKSGKSTSWSVPDAVGSMALREKGGAILALSDGIYGFDFETGKVDPLVVVTPDPRIQFTDGKVDRRGRFVVGTLDWKLTDFIGQLFRLDNDGSLHEIDNNICCSNGPCWSPDNQTFYHADTKTRTIYAYDYDIESGDISRKRPFANTDSLGGMPDGATVDRAGFLWVAVPPTGKVVCYHPNGNIERVIDMPVRMPASVMFGGKNLDALFVTSIDTSVLDIVDGNVTVRSRSGPRPENDSGDGSLFIVEGLGAEGLPEHRYGG